MPKTALTVSPVSRLRLHQAADILGVSPRSLASRAWRFKHGIPAYRIGRALVFDQDSLDRWLAKHVERRPREADR